LASYNILPNYVVTGDSNPYRSEKPDENSRSLQACQVFSLSVTGNNLIL
jgi:hypothetical protein